MNDRSSPFMYRMATWSVRSFVCAALLVFLFTLGSAGNLFATVTSEAEAACEPADVVRVRVGDLHFNLPKERQVKLASKRAELPSLLFFGLGLRGQRITQSLDGESAIAPAHNYCQDESASPADVFGFGLVPTRSGLQGLNGDLMKKFSMLWVSKVEVEDEMRRRDVLLSERGAALAGGQNETQIELYKSNVEIGLGRKPSTQYFVKLKHGGQRAFLVECEAFLFVRGIKMNPCSFMTLLDENVVLKGYFYTDRLPQNEWVEWFRQLEFWYQGLR